MPPGCGGGAGRASPPPSSSPPWPADGAPSWWSTPPRASRSASRTRRCCTKPRTSCSTGPRWPRPPSAPARSSSPSSGPRCRPWRRPWLPPRSGATPAWSEWPCRVVGTPSRYVAGEETALVHWLNGGEAKPDAGAAPPLRAGRVGPPHARRQCRDPGPPRPHRPLRPAVVPRRRHPRRSRNHPVDGDRGGHPPRRLRGGRRIVAGRRGRGRRHHHGRGPGRAGRRLLRLLDLRHRGPSRHAGGGLAGPGRCRPRLRRPGRVAPRGVRGGRDRPHHPVDGRPERRAVRSVRARPPGPGRPVAGHGPRRAARGPRPPRGCTACSPRSRAAAPAGTPTGWSGLVRSALRVFATEIAEHHHRGPCAPSGPWLPTPAIGGWR